MSRYDQMHPALQEFYDFKGKRTDAERNVAWRSAHAKAAADRDWKTPAPLGPCHGESTDDTLAGREKYRG